jgi:hypothetical protein
MMPVLADRLAHEARVAELVNAASKLLMHRDLGVDFPEDYHALDKALKALTDWRHE